MKTPLDRHVPFYAAAVVGVLGLALVFWIPGSLAVVVAANLFFAVYLALTLAGLPKLTAAWLRKHAASSDAPVPVIFLITLGAVAVATASLFMMINGRNTPVFELVLALAAVPLGWLTIHMMAAIHYAHVYWQPEKDAEGRSATDPAGRKGLVFPGTKEPRGVDFVYFSLVIGMTAQTSDVEIVDSHMRAIFLVHAIVSFFFNTVLVAAAVNLAVSLGS